MVENIEQRIYALARRYNGVYLMNNEAKQKLLNAKTDLDTDMQLDVTEAEDLMEEFLKNLMLIEGILTYTPTTLMSLFMESMQKFPVVMVPDFTIECLLNPQKRANGYTTKMQGAIEWPYLYIFLTNDGGTMICGSCDVAHREGSIELRGLQHNLSLPTDSATERSPALANIRRFSLPRNWIALRPICSKRQQRVRPLKRQNSGFTILTIPGKRRSITESRWRTLRSFL